MLTDEQYKTGITELYNDQCSDNVSCTLLWEYLKMKIKVYTIYYCIKKSKSTKSEIKDLEEKLDLLMINLTTKI